MKFKGIKLSKRTLALLAAAILLLGSGGVMGTKAVLNAQTGERLADFGTDAISVALYEVVNEQQSVVTDGAKLFESIGDIVETDTGDKKTVVEPGRAYTDEVGVKNDGGADEYVRVVVRKYWTAPKATKKSTDLSPALIDLTYDKTTWNAVEGPSPEETIYYYTPGALASGASAPLFTAIKIDKEVASAIKTVTVEEEQTEGGGKAKITTYEYKYDGYTFTVEAEAQSVQTHHASEAIKSVWGVDADDTGIKGVQK